MGCNGREKGQGLGDTIFLRHTKDHAVPWVYAHRQMAAWGDDIPVPKRSISALGRKRGSGGVWHTPARRAAAGPEQIHLLETLPARCPGVERAALARQAQTHVSIATEQVRNALIRSGSTTSTPLQGCCEHSIRRNTRRSTRRPRDLCQYLGAIV